MQAGSVKQQEYVSEEQLIWEIEISDLGACRPFLGFSLTNQYVLVGITAPDQQNEVTITSIPNQDVAEISIPLELQKFEFPISGNITFKGIKYLSDQWKFRLLNSKTGRSISIKHSTKLSLRKLGQDLVEDISRAKASTKNNLSLQMIKK